MAGVSFDWQYTSLPGDVTPLSWVRLFSTCATHPISCSETNAGARLCNQSHLSRVNTLKLLQSDQMGELAALQFGQRPLQSIISYLTLSLMRDFCIFQVFTSSESLSQPNQGVRWGESEPLTETLGRMLRCISPLSVETAWMCLISSLTETPRMESSLSARWDWERSLHAGKKFTSFKFWTKLIFPTCTSSLSSCEINVKNTKYSFVFHW